MQVKIEELLQKTLYLEVRFSCRQICRGGVKQLYRRSTRLRHRGKDCEGGVGEELLGQVQPIMTLDNAEQQFTKEIIADNKQFQGQIFQMQCNSCFACATLTLPHLTAVNQLTLPSPLGEDDISIFFRNRTKNAKYNQKIQQNRKKLYGSSRGSFSPRVSVQKRNLQEVGAPLN